MKTIKCKYKNTQWDKWNKIEFKVKPISEVFLFKEKTLRIKLNGRLGEENFYWVKLIIPFIPLYVHNCTYEIYKELLAISMKNTATPVDWLVKKWRAF